jgi:membrane-associated protease RseP (regulator of RpoE activity)
MSDKVPVSEGAGMFTYERLYQQQMDVVGRLRQALEGLLNVADIRSSERGDSVMFVGQLLNDAESVYDPLRERFRQIGYTPILRHEGGTDIVVAQRGTVPLARFNPAINLLLLVATIFTTLFAGASFADVNAFSALRAAWMTGDFSRLIPALIAGAPFALTLLAILGVHEMGHYVAARLHRVQVTLPYFIPVPFGLGTFGAFIQLKSPVENRKALFDVGLAGPIAGFVVAVPLMIFGLLQSEVGPREMPAVGSSLLIRWLVDVVVPHAANQAVHLSPIAIAAWFGLLVTGFNLLPMGQLDGGHIAYAVLGKAARPVAMATFLGLLALGFTVWNGWWTWAFFALLTGLRHAEPLNDITPLNAGRKVVALLTLVLFFLIITPKPF